MHLFGLYVEAVAGKIGKFFGKTPFCLYRTSAQQIYMYNWHINFSFLVVFLWIYLLRFLIFWQYL